MTVYAVSFLLESEDPDAFSTWFYARYEGIVASNDGVVSLTSEVEHDGEAVDAAAVLSFAIDQSRLATVADVDLDLVNTTDIAERVGLSRQYVRDLSRGTKGPGGFPLPLGSPGGVRVWDWGSVNEWLRPTGHADELVHLTLAQMLTVKQRLAQQASGHWHSTFVTSAVARRMMSTRVLGWKNSMPHMPIRIEFEYPGTAVTVGDDARGSGLAQEVEAYLQEITP